MFVFKLTITNLLLRIFFHAFCNKYNDYEGKQKISSVLKILDNLIFI